MRSGPGIHAGASSGLEEVVPGAIFACSSLTPPAQVISLRRNLEHLPVRFSKSVTEVAPDDPRPFVLMFG